mmetsp:Transcript_37647/g.87004  ORF Transcript_37647/g.87004 Transcript_37647/m.87004 type:complete len:216 (+) Transcript_37647:771-1418(+)
MLRLLPILRVIMGTNSVAHFQDGRGFDAPLFSRHSQASMLEELPESAGVTYEALELFQSDEAVIIHVHHRSLLSAPADVRTHVPKLLAIQFARVVHIKATEGVRHLRHLVLQAVADPFQKAFGVLDVFRNHRFTAATHPVEEVMWFGFGTHGLQVRVVVDDPGQPCNDGCHVGIFANTAQSLHNVVVPSTNAKARVTSVRAARVSHGHRRLVANL